MTGVRTTDKEHVEAAVKTLVEIAEEVVAQLGGWVTECVPNLLCIGPAGSVTTWASHHRT